MVLQTYEVHHHLAAPPATTSTIDPLYETNDSLVVMWIYSTISPKLVEMIVDVDSTTHGVWKRLKDLFHDNKDARITQLDNEIRNMVIGTSTITDFFQLIKSKADRLANLDSPVKDSSLVTYAINGIRRKYPDAARVIHLCEKAPTFDELRSMMLLEESDMSHTSHGNSLFHNTSSSPTVLVASTTTSDKTNTMGNSGLEVCRNFKCGSCSYGTHCKFVHVDQDMRPRPNTNNSVTRNVSSSRGPTTTTRGPVSGSGHTSASRRTQHNPTQVRVVWLSGSNYYASASFSDYDFSRTNMEHGYWGVLSSSREHSTGDLYPVTQQPSSTTTFTLLSLSPTTWHRRLGHPSEDVLRHEYSALISNGTWALVPRPANVNIVRSMWLFKHKFNADGSLSRYKAPLVANGRNQQQGIDCDETFSLVVKPATIHTVLSLAVTREWPIHQLDVKNAFLHGQLSETVYMHQPPGFVDSSHPNYVCHLQRSLYELKQALWAWFQWFASFITRVGFQYSKTDTSLFVYHMGSDVAYLLLYVDEIILTASSTALLKRIITLLHSEFAMTDLGSLNDFLGISAQRSKSGLFLSQSKFAEEILERAHMQHCNPCKTPVDTESKIGSDGDPTLYRSLRICLYMHDPRDPHFFALKRILRYVRGTIDHGLQLHVSSISQLTAYADADWAGCHVTRRSTSVYCVFLGDNLLSCAKRQVTLSRFSVEAEYRGVANVVAETAWLRNLLLELHAPLSTATLVYCDNVNVVYLQVRVLHVPSRFQYADIFTKGLPTTLFLEFCSSLNVRRPPAQTAREY
ncbi:ribonuclease H-like domain-containing protein [Tanacetum coccineum]